MHRGENYQDFFKLAGAGGRRVGGGGLGGGVFLGHYLIIIKLTLGFFSQNFAISLSRLQLGTKEQQFHRLFSITFHFSY